MGRTFSADRASRNNNYVSSPVKIPESKVRVLSTCLVLLNSGGSVNSESPSHDSLHVDAQAGLQCVYFVILETCIIAIYGYIDFSNHGGSRGHSNILLPLDPNIRTLRGRR